MKLVNGMEVKFYVKNMYMFTGYIKGVSKGIVSTTQGKFTIQEDGTWRCVHSCNKYNAYIGYKIHDK